jgi:predicted dehydrogenase
MHTEPVDRRRFIRSASIAGIGLTLGGRLTAEMLPDRKAGMPGTGKRVGIIGLDTSHSTAFVEALNKTNPDPVFEGYRVVAAYPQGSTTIKSSYERIPAYTEEVKKLGVEILPSIPDLLARVDVVLLETNDGIPHLEQALMVMKAGKPLFVDKPVAGTLKDVIAVFDAARRYKVPIFSSSSLRYMNGMQDIASGKTVGKVIGADAFSPSHLESHHPDFFWYGIHGVEALYTMMGKGCKEVVRVHTTDTDVVVGTWFDQRIGTFRGTRTGANEYGGTAFGEKGVARVGPYSGYDALLVEIIRFFDTGIAPVSEEETLEIYAFMEAADESKRSGGRITLASVMDKAKKG